MQPLYLIQTYKNPKQIYRLVRTLRQSNPESLVLISHNFSGCHLDVTYCKQTLGVLEVLPAPGGRGGFGLVQGYLEAIAWVFQQQISFNWLINLSGQDYPTQPLQNFETFLASTEYDGFLNYFAAFSAQCPWGSREGRDRYLYHYRHFNFPTSPQLRQRFLNRVQSAFNRVQPWWRICWSYDDLMVGIKAKNSPFNSQFACYGGSYFHTLSQACVRCIHDFAQSHLQVIDYYKSTCLPDESLIHSILLNSNSFNLCHDYKRYIDFTQCQDGRPRWLSIEDYPALTASNVYFARKFDPAHDSKILDMLDTHIFHPESKVLC